MGVKGWGTWGSRDRVVGVKSGGVKSLGGQGAVGVRGGGGRGQGGCGGQGGGAVKGWSDGSQGVGWWGSRW